MKFKEVHIIKCPRFSDIKFITSYHSNRIEHNEMIEKFSTCIPRKGDVITVIDKNTHKESSLKVKLIRIDYIEDSLIIYC
jgi:hypothetical protein